MRNRMYGGVRGRKTKVGEKLLRFPPTRLAVILSINEIDFCYLLSHSSIALAITSKLVVGSKRATT